jgi:hypothetical protein
MRLDFDLDLVRTSSAHGAIFLNVDDCFGTVVWVMVDGRDYELYELYELCLNLDFILDSVINAALNPSSIFLRGLFVE